MIGGDAGVGFEGGDEVVHAGLKGGQGVFRAKAAAAAVSGDVEVLEVLALRGGGGGGAFFPEDLLEDVGAIGDEAVDAHADLGADGLGVVGVPGDDAEAGGVEVGDGDGVVEDGGVVRREDGADFDAVLLRVGPGGVHELEERVLLGGLCESHGDEGGEQECGEVCADQHGSG